MQCRVPKLILVIYFVVLLLAKKRDHFEATSFSGCKQRCLTELILDRRTQTPLHQVVAGLSLAALGSCVKQAVTKSVLVGQRIHAAFIKLYDVHEAVLGCGEHEVTRSLALGAHTRLTKNYLGFQTAVDRGES